MNTPARLDDDRCYQALLSRDARFDGQFIAGITSTGIYCRASCPAPVRPKRTNVRVFATAAAAQAAGFRSCKRCRPDASPGSPEWDQRGDLVGRAMRLIEAGEVDRAGVGGVAARLHVSQRHLNRVLNETVGAGPIALARAQRANLARILLETTDMAITDLAFAAGFSSVRQFNDTIRAVYDRTPTELRRTSRRRPGGAAPTDGVTVSIRLAARPPVDHRWLLTFFADHRVPGVSVGDIDRYARSLRLPDGPGHVEVETDGPDLRATFTLTSVSDLAPAIAIVRRLFDLDADPVLINDYLEADPLIGPLRAAHPGVRIPGSADGVEAAIGAVISQQVSVRAASTFLGRLVEVAGVPYRSGSVTHVFPDAARIADSDLGEIGLTRRREETVRAMATALAEGAVDLSGAQDRSATRSALLALPGVGPWTADVIMMRALHDPDVLLGSDLIVRRQLASLGTNEDDHRSWSPWRSYVTATLWAASGGG